MTTKNRSVACYLPHDIEEKLKEYCRDEKILQSDGTTPKMGTAILEILKLYFGILPSDLASTISRENLEDVVKRILLDVLPSTIPTFNEVVVPSQVDHRAASIISDFNSAITQLDARIKELELLTTKLKNNPAQDALQGVSNPKKVQSQTKLSNDDLPLLFENETADDRSIGISDAGLAAILKVNRSTTWSWRKGKSDPTKNDPDFWDKWKLVGDHWFPVETQ